MTNRNTTTTLVLVAALLVATAAPATTSYVISRMADTNADGIVDGDELAAYCPSGEKAQVECMTLYTHILASNAEAGGFLKAQLGGEQPDGKNLGSAFQALWADAEVVEMSHLASSDTEWDVAGPKGWSSARAEPTYYKYKGTARVWNHRAYGVICLANCQNAIRRKFVPELNPPPGPAPIVKASPPAPAVQPPSLPCHTAVEDCPPVIQKRTTIIEHETIHVFKETVVVEPAPPNPPPSRVHRPMPPCDPCPEKRHREEPPQAACDGICCHSPAHPVIEFSKADYKAWLAHVCEHHEEGTEYHYESKIPPTPCRSKEHSGKVVEFSTWDEKAVHVMRHERRGERSGGARTASRNPASPERGFRIVRD